MGLAVSSTNASQQWVKEVLGHVENAQAKERIAEFLSKEAALRIVEDWVLPEEKPTMALTDMSDVYKISMMGPFARIQRKFDKEHGPGAFVVRFSLHVRESSELPLEEIFRRASREGGESKWAKIRDTWLKDVFALPSRPFDVEVLRQAPQALPAALKGVVRLEEETLTEVQGQPQTDGAVSMRLFLKPKGKPVGEWLEILAGKDGGPCTVKAPGSDALESVSDAVARLATPGFELVVNAEGPWHIVTFFETSLMQVTARALGQGMQLLRNWSDTKFYAAALELLDQRTSFLRDDLSAGSPFDIFVFSGRRATHAGVHLLQNLWCCTRLPGYKGTSSLFAYRVFRGYGWLGDDAKPKCEDLKEMPLVGTHAHEGSMVFQAIAAAADDEFELPMSSVLWHMNYWLVTGNQAMLSDTTGSPAFAHILNSLQLPPKFVESWNARHGPDRKLKGDISIAEELRDPSIGGMVRQDSGSTRTFVELVFSPPIHPVVDQGSLKWKISVGNVSPGYKCLASEISTDQDVKDVRALGYMGMGTGGYLGEKPWALAGKQGPNGDELTGRVDLVAKVSRVQMPGGGFFFPVKLGDYDKVGEWHAERPGKFAVSPEIKGSGADEQEEEIFRRFKRQGEVLESAVGLANVSNYPESARKPKKFDQEAGWRQERFNELWEQFNFV